MQYNFYKLSKDERYDFTFDFLLTFKKFCFQPIHLCIQSDELTISIGWIFVRATIRLTKWGTDETNS
jgi:hypothetical protein